MTTLYLICGMAGSGKTTLARELESSRRALRFSPDEWIKAIIKDETDKEEVERLRDLVEKLQWNTAREVIRLGVSVILENGFWSKEERMVYRNQGKELGAAVELHYLNVSDEELWRRIQKRNSEGAACSFMIAREELARWREWFTPPDPEEAVGYDNFQEHRQGTNK